MFYIDNETGAKTRPDLAPVFSKAVLWFTDEVGKQPSIPHAEWFNMVQAELMNVVTGAGLSLDKMSSDQVLKAIQKLVKDGEFDPTSINNTLKVHDQRISNVSSSANAANNAAKTADDKAVKAQNTANTAVTNASTAQNRADSAYALAEKKIDKTSITNELGTSTTLVASQKLVSDVDNKLLGINQLYRTVTNQRVIGITYINTQERPIYVVVRVQCGSGIFAELVDSSNRILGGFNTTSTQRQEGYIQAIIPPNFEYKLINKLTGGTNGITLVEWTEMY